jgi:antitoxin component of MazEF toxin-antitoxin module
MIKKLARHGNSMALVMEKGVLDLLKISVDTPLRISTDGEVLIISPVRAAARRRKFEETLTKVNRAYGRALRRLAD